MDPLKKFITILICIISINAFSQATKKVKKKYKNPWYTEKYNVLKSDKKIKQGNFKKLGYNNCLVIDGYYINDTKDGLWTYYYWRSKQIKKQGKFQNNKRIDEWNFYSSDGILIQTYDFTNKKIIYSIPPKEETIVIIEEQEIKKILISNAQFIGSGIELYEYISPVQMEMVQDEEYDLKTGSVIISLFISTNGKPINYKIESGISDKIDQKCLKIVKSIPNLWIPAKDENGNVISKYTIPINFRIG